MEKHVTILAVLYLVFGGLGLFGGGIAFLTIAGGGLLSGDAETMLITGSVATVMAIILVAFSLPMLLAGYGLLKHYAWARIVALVLGFLNLLSIPFGTILGIYTIWVLLKDETAQLFAAPATS